MTTIFSWNVNGIRAVLRKGELQAFLAAHQPDILCLQETKAQRGQVDVDFPDYHEFWHSADQKGYSGTAIFSREKPITVTNGFPTAITRKFSLIDADGRDARDEGRVITAEFERFSVVTVYTPNAKEDMSRLAFRETQWDPAFLAYCRALEKKKPVVFCGDLNVAHTPLDLANPTANVGKKGFTVEERRGIDAIVKAGFVDTLRLFREGNGHYTWWSHRANSRARNIGWRIDYVFVSGALRSVVRAAEIHAGVMGSDHCPVSITLEL